MMVALILHLHDTYSLLPVPYVHDTIHQSIKPPVHSFLYREVRSFRPPGTPISRLPFFKPLLELAGLSLTNESHPASTHIPQIESHKFDRVREEVRGNYISRSFDGSTRHDLAKR